MIFFFIDDPHLLSADNFNISSRSILITIKGAGTTDERGEIHTNEVPDAAVLGSFWATSLDGGLVGMRAGWREETIEEKVAVTAGDNLQILLANEGRQAEVILTDGKRASGLTISSILPMMAGSARSARRNIWRRPACARSRKVCRSCGQPLPGSAP